MTGMRRDEQLSAALFAMVALWSIGVALVGSTDVLLFVAPALLLAVPLLLGRYPGETALAVLRERIAAPRPPRPASTPAPRVRPRPVAIRGSLLIGSGLARRGPPAAALLT